MSSPPLDPRSRVLALPPAQFLEEARSTPVFDVRAPAEFAKGHIPGAHTLPLFTDEERALVGTLYHREGRDEAVRRGLDLVGPKLRDLVDRAEQVTGPGRRALVHCWRGGMRSAGVAWLLGTAGFDVAVLDGGYKSFRRHCNDLFSSASTIRIVGGRTGAGKTEVLARLAERGESVLDLEAIAHHKGSVFGAIDEPPQPEQQQFENDTAFAFRDLDRSRTVWIEHESRQIGQVFVPEALWKRMRKAPIHVLDVPEPVRAERLAALYGGASRETLAQAFRAIRSRLGDERSRTAVAAVHEGDLLSACRISLAYYDRAYDHALSKHVGPTDRVHVDDPASSEAFAEALLASVRAAG